MAWLRELGFDVAFDYHDTKVRDALADGIDVYFDNVGEATLEAALTAMRLRGRVVACGSISGYNDERRSPGLRNLFLIVTKRLRMEGYIISDHYDRYPAFLAEMAAGPRRRRAVPGDDRRRHRAGAAGHRIGLLEGENVGKMLVRVGPEP